MLLYKFTNNKNVCVAIEQIYFFFYQQRQSSIAQPRESGLYEHYYKTLEEVISVFVIELLMNYNSTDKHRVQQASFY